MLTVSPEQVVKKFIWDRLQIVGPKTSMTNRSL